jgi:acyl-CoA thioester hydrolase
MTFKKEFQSIWADLDPNGHMRHTAYNDYAAQLRLNFFDEHGFSFARLIEMGIGPILFREETRFLREVRMNEVITVDFAIKKARKDASKWTMRHQIFKYDGQISASIEVDGAWLDLHKRKVIVPPQEIVSVMLEAPRTEDFEWLPDKKGGH